MRFAICNEQFEGWPFDRVCRFVHSAGYEGLEVAPFTLAPSITDVSPARRAELKQQAADAGVEILGLHWLLAKTDGLCLTSPETAVRRRTTAYLVALAHACRDLGGDVMVFGSPAQRSLQPGVTRNQGLSGPRHVPGVLPSLRGPWRHDLHGTVRPTEIDFNTCEEAQHSAESGGPSHSCRTDVKATAAKRTADRADLRYGHDVGHFHANDANRRGPGSARSTSCRSSRRPESATTAASVEVFDFHARSRDDRDACMACGSARSRVRPPPVGSSVLRQWPTLRLWCPDRRHDPDDVTDAMNAARRKDICVAR
jgi:hypothetical protein